MKRIKQFSIIALLACFSITQTGCIGGFKLTRNVLNFNRDLGNKFVEEAVFIAFLIIPVYEFTTLVDALIINTIEFWTGRNPISYLNDEGELIEITKGKNGYAINNLETGEQLKVYYDEASNIVYAETNGELLKLVEYMPNTNEALVFLPDGEIKTVDCNSTNFDIRNELSNSVHLALK